MIINLNNGTYVEIFSGVDSTTVEIFDERGLCLATCSASVEVELPDMVETEEE